MLAQGAPSRAPITAILVPGGGHPAVISAAKILAGKLKLAESAIGTYEGAPRAAHGSVVLALVSAGHLPAAEVAKNDGYTVTYSGGMVVWGVRPRSLLFAAGEPERWNIERGAAWVRSPDFAIRVASRHPGHPVAEVVSLLGVNVFTAAVPAAPTLQALPEVFAAVPAATQAQMKAAAARHVADNVAIVKEFHDADVEVYALLPYGNNFQNWSRALYDAVLTVYPSAKGTPEEHSHENAALCPSDPATWKVFDAFVKEWAEQTQADGISATFWDAYGAYCQDARCTANGLNKFPNELYEFISHYHAVLHPMGQKMHLRTWSSGSPHWLGTNYVHAPGYGQFGLTHPELWGRVIKETPADVLMQTKVYHSDCEPDPRFTTLLGKCKPHTEIVEYQMVGQTLGRHYWATSTVDYTAKTLKRSLPLVGTTGGAHIDPGATMQTNFDLFSDILNSANTYAWRQLTWNVNADLDAMWAGWAEQFYAPGAVAGVVRYMRASEEACYRCFSPLGHGSSTNSDFAGNIARRETLLKYTNRYYLPEYAVFLEPTKENVEKCAAEKARCLAHIDEMDAALTQARPHLTKEQDAELTTRLDWLRQFAICNVTLDESLWRFRYLRALAGKQTTDWKQMQELSAAWDRIEAAAPKLFAFDPALQFSCYDTTLGGLQRRPNLGNPRSLMREIYDQSYRFVLDAVGPDYIPKEWVRGTVTSVDIPTEQRPGRQG
jgi:hypothetical protein